MRQDMYKVIVERPRRRKYKSGDAFAARLRNDFDGPMRIGMRAGYGYLYRNENLVPLRRYLHAQVGRPWDKVYAEICATIDRRNAVQRHIFQHLGQFIATNVDIRDGRLVDMEGDWHGAFTDVSQALYVDPRTGLIRRSADRFREARGREDRAREAARLDACRRVLDERTRLLQLGGVWFHVVVDTQPTERVVEVLFAGRLQKRVVRQRHDAVLRKEISQATAGERLRCAELYGSSGLYAVSKRQLSKRELKAHGLHAR
jgi:hypothetical protein